MKRWAIQRKRLASQRTKIYCSFLAIVLCGVGIFAVIAAVYGAGQLPERSIQLSSSQRGVTANYKIGFTIATAGTLGSIRVQFCANDPLINTPCTIPADLDITNAVLASQTGETGFSISGLSTHNVLVLTRSPAPAVSQPVTYELSGVHNPTALGSYYARIQTYASNNTSGTNIDNGGVAFNISDQITINAEVPPYLQFCTGVTIAGTDCSTANGDYINFGELSATQAAKGQSQMVAATNAAGGYGITASGSTMTSGNNVIPALAVRDVSRPGTSQFGINLRANVAPAVGADPAGPGNGTGTANYSLPNFYRFVSGDVVAGSAGADDYRNYTVSYLTNIAPTQPAGVYATTFTYICLANF